MWASNEQKGALSAIFSGFLYGFLGFFGVNAIHENLSPSNMLFWRFTIAALFILVISYRQIISTKHAKLEISKAFLSGALYYGFSTWFYFLACQHMSSGLAMVVFFTYPMFIMLINSLFFGQLIDRIYYLASMVIFTGLWCLITVKNFNIQGIEYAILSAFFYAIYIIFSKKITLNLQISSFMVCVGCAFTAGAISLLSTGKLLFPPSITAWYYLLGIGILSTAFPILLLLQSLRFISSEKASLLSILEPVFVVIFGVLLLGETLSRMNLVGIILVLLGAAITLMKPKHLKNLFKKNKFGIAQ